MKRSILAVIMVCVVAGCIYSAENGIAGIARTRDFLGDVKWYPVTTDGSRDFGYYLYQRFLVGGGYNYTLYENRVTDFTQAPVTGIVDPRYIIVLEKRFRNMAWWGGMAAGMLGGMTLCLISGGIVLAVDDEDTGEIIMAAGGGTFLLFGAVFGVISIINAILTVQARNRVVQKLQGAISSIESGRLKPLCDIGNDTARIGASVKL
jgi:hypothetical protein